MKAIPSQNVPEANVRSPRLVFNCVVIHEDLRARVSAELFHENLVAAMDANGRSTRNRWAFSALAIPEMRNVAASAAVLADVVILALSGRDPLPAPVKEWIEMWAWLIEDTRPSLAALFESLEGESGTISGYLRSVTARKHLDFFPHSASVPASASIFRLAGKAHSTRETWADAKVGLCGAF